MIAKIRTHPRYLALLPALLSSLVIFTAAYAANIDTADKWAYGANIGWLNFAPAHGGATVYDDHLEGYIWAENIGWIRLGTYESGGAHTYANTSAADWGVNHSAGALSGYGWSGNAGWVNFSPTHGGVTVDPATGVFDGYAWSENLGWIHFQNASPAYGVACDCVPPTVTVAAVDVTQANAGQTSYTFTVEYTDSDNGVDVSSIDTGDVSVAGATVTGASPNTTVDGSPITVTYTILPPGGYWDDGDNGNYTIALAANQVADANTPPAYVAANASLATFNVSMDTTAPTAGAPTNTPQTLKSGDTSTSTVQSGEAGNIYLILNTVTDPTTQTEIDAAVTAGNAFLGVSGATADTPYTVTVPAVINEGTFDIFAVDAVGNVSGATAGWLTVVNTSYLSDIIHDTGFTSPANIDYAGHQAGNVTDSDSVAVARFTIRDGGGAADADGLDTTLTNITFGITNWANLRKLAVYDAVGTVEIQEAAVNSASVPFTGLSGLSAADNGSQNFVLRATFNDPVTDNQQFSFTITSATAGGSGSGFAAADAGGAVSSTAGDDNRIEVTATRMVFTIQPTNTAAGSNISGFAVSAYDSLGNPDLDYSSPVSLSINSNPGSGALGGTTSVNAASGVATFNAVNLNKTGTGYTLDAGSGGLTGGTSNAFNITPGTAHHLAFGTQPTNTMAGSDIPAFTVQVLDVNDNVVTGSSATVTLSINSNPGSGALGGTTSVHAASGVATFNAVNLNKTGAGYTLDAGSDGLTGATSNEFNITIDLSDAIIILQQLAGIDPDPALNDLYDVNSDNRTGLEEVIYILRNVAGLGG